MSSSMVTFRLRLLSIAFPLFALHAGMLVISPLWGGLARELGYSELLAGAITAVAPLFWMFTSPLVGKFSDQFGRRPFIRGGVLLSCVAQAVFSMALYLALENKVSPMFSVTIMALSRGLIGIAGAMAVVAAFAFAADLSTPAQRSSVMAFLGAVVGSGLLAGPGLAAIASGAGVMPTLLAIMALPWLGLPCLIWMPSEDRAKHVDVPKIPHWDKRLNGVLAVAWVIHLGMGSTELLLGFMFTDFTQKGLETSGPLAGLALIFGGFGVIVTQIILSIRPIGPRPLLVAGPAFSVIGCFILATISSAKILICFTFFMGIVAGVCITGWTSGASLAVGPEEQGQAAGRVQFISCVAQIMAPIVAGATYGIWRPLPWLVLAPLMGIAAVVAWTSNGLRLAQATHTASNEVEHVGALAES